MAENLPSRFVIQSIDELRFFDADGKPLTEDDLKRRREALKQREAAAPFSPPGPSGQSLKSGDISSISRRSSSRE